MATFLNYDDQGFIVGTRRLESGIKSIGEDTQEIIQILKSQNQINQTVLNRIAKSNERIANKKSMRIKGVVPTYDPTSPGRNNASQPSMQGQAQSKQQHRQQLSSASQTAQKEARAAGRKSSDTLSNITSSAQVKSGSTPANRANNQSDSGSSGANRLSAGRGGAQSLEVANNAAGSVPGAAGAARKANNPTGKNGREKKKNDSDRDELGRFTAKEKTLFDSLSKIAKSGGAGYGSYGGAQDIDPLIASANEVKDIASPIFNMATKAGKMGGAAGKAALRAGRFSLSKYKSLKRKEPLPKEQARHNKQNEETLGEILKRMPGGEGSLLGKMGRGLGLLGGGKGKGKGKDKAKDKGKGKGKGVKAILSGAGAAVLGAGKIGGEGVKKAAKVVGSAKVLGPLATAVGMGNLIGQWKELDHEEKSEGVGGLAGGGAGAVAGGALGTALIPVPVVGTAIGAAVGGWIGREGGEVLGRTASPYIKSWTDSIKAYNLPQKMQSKWESGLAPVLSKLREAAGGMKSWLSRMGDGVSSFFGGGDGGSGGWKVDFGSGLTSAKDGVTYKMGAKDFSGGVIDCSGWVNQLNKDTVKQIEAQLGPEAAKRARIDASGGAAGIIQSEEKKGHLMTTANSWAQLDINKLQAGMVIGESRGEHARKEGRYKGIGHIVQIVEENGVKYVSESTSAKGKDGKSGVRKTELSEYVRNLNGRQFGVTVVDPYKELRGQLSGGGGTVDVSSSRLTTKQQQAKRDEAMQYFMSQGWTKEQAAGIVGNIQKESMFNYKALGDKNKQGVYQAYGLAQWHPDRQADFKKAFGKDIKQASYKEQLAFINYELTKGDEKAAGNKLKKAKTAGQAGAIVSEFYERPKAVEAEKRERARIAEGIYNNTVVQSVQKKTKTTNSILGVNVGGLANNFVAGNTPAYQPASQSIGLDLGTSILKNVLNIPEMPSFKLPLAGGGLDKPIVVQSNNESIGQNVSDRDLAHAITGGIGMSRAWG